MNEATPHRRYQRVGTLLTSAGLLAMGLATAAVSAPARAQQADTAPSTASAEGVCPEGFAHVEAGAFEPGLYASAHEWDNGSFDVFWRLGVRAAEPDPDAYTLVTLTHDICVEVAPVDASTWAAIADPAGMDDPPADETRDGVTWFEAARWLNARSEAEGLDACYRIEGCSDPSSDDCWDEVHARICEDGLNQGGRGPRVVSVGYDCEGYRLMTEAEWEWSFLPPGYDADIVNERDANARGLHPATTRGRAMEWVDGGGAYHFVEGTDPWEGEWNNRMAIRGFVRVADQVVHRALVPMCRRDDGDPNLFRAVRTVRTQ